MASSNIFDQGNLFSGANLFGGSSGSGHHGLLYKIGHAPLTFAEHLGKDVRDAAVGLAALPAEAKHPLRLVENIGSSTWHDWSPLFHGDLKKFGSQFWAHPLAPLLDVASVASLAGTAASLGLDAPAAIATLGGRTALAEGSTLARLSELGKALRAPGELKFHDPAIEAGRMARPTMVKEIAPLRTPVGHFTQQAFHKLGAVAEAKLPKWFGKDAPLGGFGPSGKYEHLLRKEVAMRRNVTGHAVADDYMAMHQQFQAAYNAGKLLDTNMHNVEQHILDYAHGQLRDKAIPIPAEEGLKRPKGWLFVKEQQVMRDTTRHPDFASEMKAFGARATTRDLSQAAKDAHGNVLVVPHHVLKRVTQDGAESVQLLKKLYRGSTGFWKKLLIGWRPASAANVSIGNVVMTAIDQMGPRAPLAVLDAFRMAHGDRVAFDRFAKMGRIERPWMTRHFRNVINSGFASNMLGESSDQAGKLAELAGHPVAKFIRKGPSYYVIHKVEQGLKRFVIAHEVRNAPEVRALMRKGASFDQAAEKALAGPDGAALRQRISQRALKTVGDYQLFTPGEKAIQDFVPFFSWDRHIMRHVSHIVMEHPTRAAVMATAGQQGEQQIEAMLGQLPDFLKGVMPFGMMGLKPNGPGGRINVLATHGLNPYGSAADIFDALRGLTTGGGGEALAQQLNPLITSAIEAATGKSLLTGGAVQTHGGVLSSVLENTLNSLPEVRIARQEAFGSPPPGKTPPLYAKNMQALISAYLGAPIKQVDLSKAAQLAGGKKKKKTGSTNPFDASTNPFGP